MYQKCYTLAYPSLASGFNSSLNTEFVLLYMVVQLDFTPELKYYMCFLIDFIENIERALSNSMLSTSISFVKFSLITLYI